MEGQRIENAFSFECRSLESLTVESLQALYLDKDKTSVLMLILGLKEKTLMQRFFLDAGIGFWEEWDEESTQLEIEDLEVVDLAKSLRLTGKKVRSIRCVGSPEESSSIAFRFDGVALLLKPSHEKDLESDSVLEWL